MATLILSSFSILQLGFIIRVEIKLNSGLIFNYFKTKNEKLPSNKALQFLVEGNVKFDPIIRKHQ